MCAHARAPVCVCVCLALALAYLGKPCKIKSMIHSLLVLMNKI